MTDRPCPICHRHKHRLKYVADEFRVVRCKYCGFVYTANPVEQDQGREAYDEYFEASPVLETGQHAAPDPAAMDIYRTRLSAIQKIKSDGSLLEIGCGRGYFLNMAAQAGYKVNGIEISPVAAHYAGLHYGLDVHVADFETMEFDHDAYDTIVMWHVLEHFRDPLGVLQSVYELLDDKGSLFIEVPNLNSLKFRLAPMGKKWQGGNHPRYHMSFFSYGQLKQLLTKCGFSIAGSLNLNYAEQNNPVKSIVKSLLSPVHLDSFLSVRCIKQDVE